MNEAPNPPGAARWAWLPIPLFLVAMAVLWVADLRVAWPSTLLSWLVHYGSVALGVTLIVIPAARFFLANGQPSVLMLGCGVLMMDIGVTAMPAATSRSSDTGFAIYNTSVLLAALCHFAGVAITTWRKIRLKHSTMWLAAAYAGGTAAMGLVIWSALTGRMPEFFVEGEGGTLLRSVVVTTAVALFVLTAVLLWQTNRRAASAFFYWYALGLVLLAAGLAGSMAITMKDSPLQWVARFTQFFGGVYMCVAVLVSTREGGKGIPLAAVEEAWGEQSFLASFRQQTPLGWGLRYGLAVAAVAAALGFRLVVTVWVGPGLPAYITFYPAVMVVALLGGLGPGLLATALAALAAGYWILPPVGFYIGSPVDRLGLVLFASMGLFMSVVAEVYRRRRHKAAAYDREAALRESQARLATFAAATFEGIVESEEGRILDCNEQYARMAGYSVAELRGMEIASLVAPEDRDRVVGLIRQGEESRTEHAMIRKDGRRIVVEVHGRPVSPGSARRHTAIRDITERKQADMVLQTTVERFYTVLSSMYSAVLLVTDEGRVEFANQALCDSFGLTDAPADLVGLKAPDMIQKIKDGYLHSEEAVARIREIVERGQAVRGEEVPMRGGRMSLRDFVPLKVRGKSYGRLWIHFDITERKRAEAALKASEERYRSLFNTIDAGFCVIEMIFDPAGKPADYRFLEVNAAFERQTGLHGAEGKRMRELVPAHEAHWFEIYGKIALTGEAAHFVNEAKALNRWYDVYAYRVGQPEGRQVAILFNDVTAHKQAETEIVRRAEELRAANDELTRFNRITMGRELRIIELKKQVNELHARLGQPVRYAVEVEGEARPTP